MKILVSACLLGIRCRYDGTEAECADAMELARRHALVPVCPEQLGGLPTPRQPAELRDGRVVTGGGQDFTEAYRAGAEAVAKIARLLGCTHAVLKQKSPSCGCGQVYDGSFGGRLVSGDGITTRLLKENGVTVLCEHDLRKSERFK